MAALEFRDNDAGYLTWLHQNQAGFVVNTRRRQDHRYDPQYMVLHSANCWSIGVANGAVAPGGFTEREYQKICATSMGELETWVAAHGRPDGSFSKVCSHCAPIRV